MADTNKTIIELNDAKQETEQHLPPQFHGLFNEIYGELPFVAPNVVPGTDMEDQIYNLLNKEPKNISDKMAALCIKSILTLGVYTYSNWRVVPKGHYGFKYNQGTGKWRFLRSGSHNLASMYSIDFFTDEAIRDYINHGYITIVRVPIGGLGLAKQNGKPQILEPGVHVRTDPTFIFNKSYLLDLTDTIEEPPIKIFTVKSGSVRVCFVNGKVKIYSAGRYAANSAAFTLGPIISLQQKTFKLTGHQVLLDGGINMIVEGLVIYQVENVEKLCLQSGLALDRFKTSGGAAQDFELVNRLETNIEVVCKAELSRAFSSIHLEDISSQSNSEKDFDDAGSGDEMKVTRMKTSSRTNTFSSFGEESRNRSKICSQIMDGVSPILDCWGLVLHNFQLESTKIADMKYAKDYEYASLEMAKTKSNYRTQQVQKQIVKIQAETRATSTKIEAEGEGAARRIRANADGDSKMALAKTDADVQMLLTKAKTEAKLLIAKQSADARLLEARAHSDATVLKAKAESQAKVLEGKARGEAADAMSHPFAQAFYIREKEVDMVRGVTVNKLMLTNSSEANFVQAAQSLSSALAGIGKTVQTNSSDQISPNLEMKYNNYSSQQEVSGGRSGDTGLNINSGKNTSGGINVTANLNTPNFNTPNFNTPNFNIPNVNTSNFNTSNFNTSNFNTSTPPIIKTN